MDNIFKKDPPITGGNFYNAKKEFEAKDKIIKQNYISNSINKNISELLDSKNFTYQYYFLLQQQADYFSNLVNFTFNNQQITEALYLTIRLGVIFGKSALWFRQSDLKIIPLHILEEKWDNWKNEVVYIKATIGQNVFLSTGINQDLENDFIEFSNEELNNIYIFKSNSSGFGGLVKWNPFLKQLENILKMLYTHSYSHIKFMLYDVKDPTCLKKELELFFNSESPFLINTGDDTLIRNKFKEFNFNQTNKTDFFNYIDKFLEVYYNLLGRRYNVDFKKERNITSEVEASQDNFDILQNELKTYIYLLLDWVKFKTGVIYNVRR